MAYKDMLQPEIHGARIKGPHHSLSLYSLAFILFSWSSRFGEESPEHMESASKFQAFEILKEQSNNAQLGF